MTAETFSCLSHLLAAPVFGALAWPLVRRGRPHVGRMVALGLFAISAVFLLSMSGVYHLLTPGTTGRNVLQRLDHAAIFVLIAGSFTAAHGILFRGAWWRWGMILMVWTLALTAMTFKTIFFDEISEWVGLSLYLGLGWLGLVSVVAAWWHHGFALVRPVVLGGLAYTIGALVAFADWPSLIPGTLGPHELFHVAVLAGLGFHWRAIERIADFQA